jgi:hypothetical protein
LGDSLLLSGNSLPAVMNFRFHNGFKTWSAVGLAALAVALFWPSHEEELARTTVHERHNSLDDPNLVKTESAQRHQEAIAHVTAEPILRPSSGLRVESFADQNASGSSRDHVATELVDRTPLPYGRSSCIGPEFPDMPCVTQRALDSEQIDPTWSSVTEDGLRSIWREAAADMSDEFLYVECKTTVCEVTYHFPLAPGDQQAYEERYFSQFSAALLASDLGAELCELSAGYDRLTRNVYLRRSAPQSAPRPDSGTPQRSLWCKH